MRQPEKSSSLSFSSPSSSSSSSTATTSSSSTSELCQTPALETIKINKIQPKMKWKNALIKIRGRRKLVESITEEDQKLSGATDFATEDKIIMATIDDPSKMHYVKSVSSSKKGLKIGKRSKATSADSVQTKYAKPTVPSITKVEDSESNASIQKCDNEISRTDESIEKNCSVQNSVICSPSTFSACSAEQEQNEEIISSNLHLAFTGTTVNQLSQNDDRTKNLENSEYKAEQPTDEREASISSTTRSNVTQLGDDEKRLILADFDSGMLPHEIEEKYGISKLQIADILSNRISIFRQRASNWTDLFALKRRRTVYVRLNMQVWKFFCQCREQKIWLNGRQLKEQALKIAQELGLHSFRASEGWLDSFKKRHCIDLKTMTGKPVMYETDLDDGASTNDGLEIRLSRSTTPIPQLLRDTNSVLPVLDANKFLMDATNAAVLASSVTSEGMVSPVEATAAIQTTSPLDIKRFLSCPTITANEQNMVPAAVNLTEIGEVAIKALVETCCCRVNEIEVSQAIDVLRSYIVSNNIHLLPLLVELQKGLAATAMQRKNANGFQI